MMVKDKVRYCISCRAEHNHFWNDTQKEFECSKCGLLALDEPCPRIERKRKMRKDV